MKLYEIVGSKDSEFERMTFGQFTSEELAKAGYETLPEEFREETEIKASGLKVNTVEVDGKVISFPAYREPEDVIASRGRG